MKHRLKFLRWHVLRYVGRHPLLAALNVASIALGVAVYLAIQIANESAARAFAAGVDLVAGRAQLQITSPVRGVDETVLPRLAALPEISAVTPLVRGWLALPDYPGEYLQVLGIDIFTNEPFRTFEVAGTDEFDPGEWLGRPDGIAVAGAFAHRHALKPGDSLRVQTGGATRLLRIVSILREQGGVPIDGQFAAMDIGWAQELFRQQGRVSAIQLRLREEGGRDEAQAAMAALLPPDAVVAAPSQRSAQIEKLLASFRLNLTAMSMVALLVGMFLIYNTVSASVVRRRREIGILRSLGLHRGGIRALFLAEAAVVGLLGVAAGLAGGTLLAGGLVGTVAETISSLYVLVQVREAVVAPSLYLEAALLGLISTFVAAWWPARNASRLEPVAALTPAGLFQRATMPVTKAAMTGLVLLGLSGLFSVVAVVRGPAWLGFGAAFFLLAGASCFAPGLVAGLGAVFRVFLAGVSSRRSLLPGLAAMQLARSLPRTSVTIAAVAAAVAMAVGLGTMVFSFRTTVQSWLEQTLVADLFVTTADNEATGGASFIPPEALAFARALPGVEAVDTYREVELPFGEGSLALAVIRGHPRRRFDFVGGDGPALARRFSSEAVVLISQSFARRHRLEAGDRLELPTPGGLQAFEVAGVFHDYTRDRGVVFMHEKTFQSFWQDDRVNSLALYLEPGASAEEVSEALRTFPQSAGGFAIYSNRALRERVFEIFDQTFAVTNVLRTIAIVVAILGVFLTLTTLVMERTRELGVIRSVGASAGQLRGLVAWEAGLIGLLSSVLGLAGGLGLALVLTFVINPAFFGWTIRLAIPWDLLAWTPGWIVLSALAASFVPGRRAAAINIAEAVRTE